MTINGKEYLRPDGQEYNAKKGSKTEAEKTVEGIKWVFKETEKFVTRKVNNLMKDVHFLVFQTNDEECRFSDMKMTP